MSAFFSLDDDFKSNKTYFLTFYPENDSLPFPVSIVDDGKVENLEQFGLVTSVVNSLASTGINSTARVVIVDSNGEYSREPIRVFHTLQGIVSFC